MGFMSVPINEEIMSCKTSQETLAHALRRCEAMDEVNAVTSLHRAAKLWRDEEQCATPLAGIHGDEGLGKLLQLVWHFAVRCRPQQLSNAIWACAVFSLREEALFERICVYAVQRLGGYTPQNVANTVWSLATLGFRHEEFFKAVPRYVEANIWDFTPQDLANTCWAYARLQRPCDNLFQILVGESVKRLDEFQAQNMSNLVWACASLLYKDDASMLALADYAAGCVEEFGTQELSNLTWGLATLALLSEPWMEASSFEMKRRSSECCPQDLSNTIWAYGTLLWKRNDILRAINWEVMRQIDLFSPQGLANVTWGLSAIEYRDIKTLTCISEEVMRRPVEQLTPPDISTLLYSFAVLGWLHEGALAKLRRCVRYALPVFATRDLANVSWALVTLSHRDDGLFNNLMLKSKEMLPDFDVQGLCNIAWAFVRFGVHVPTDLAVGIATETIKRREDLRNEAGDAILLSDAVCSEWLDRVPEAAVDACDAIGREPYDRVFGFLEDFNNVPGFSSPAGEVERYQSRVTAFGCIQLGRRLTVELLRRFGMLEERSDAIQNLRRPREEWLWAELQEADPTDASLQHKTTGSWALTLGDAPEGPVQVVASGTPMNATIRFASCIVEHARASDAEFIVANRAAERILAAGGAVTGTLRLDVSEIPCLSCLGVLRQFQKAFPAVRLCVSFNIRKVSEVCIDKSGNTYEEPELPPPRSHLDPTPACVPDNRGVGRPAAPARGVPARSRRAPPPTAAAVDYAMAGRLPAETRQAGAKFPRGASGRPVGVAVTLAVDQLLTPAKYGGGTASPDAVERINGARGPPHVAKTQVTTAFQEAAVTAVECRNVVQAPLDVPQLQGTIPPQPSVSVVPQMSQQSFY